MTDLYEREIHFDIRRLVSIADEIRQKICAVEDYSRRTLDIVDAIHKEMMRQKEYKTTSGDTFAGTD